MITIKSWSDLFELVDDLQAHVRDGEVILCYDDPKRRLIGWTSATATWEINLVALEESFDRVKQRGVTEQEQRIMDLVYSAAGRNKLCLEVL